MCRGHRALLIIVGIIGPIDVAVGNIFTLVFNGLMVCSCQVGVHDNRQHTGQQVLNLLEVFLVTINTRAQFESSVGKIHAFTRTSHLVFVEMSKHIVSSNACVCLRLRDCTGNGPAIEQQRVGIQGQRSLNHTSGLVFTNTSSCDDT